MVGGIVKRRRRRRKKAAGKLPESPAALPGILGELPVACRQQNSTDICRAL